MCVCVCCTCMRVHTGMCKCWRENWPSQGAGMYHLSCMYSSCNLHPTVPHVPASRVECSQAANRCAPPLHPAAPAPAPAPLRPPTPALVQVVPGRQAGVHGAHQAAGGAAAQGLPGEDAHPQGVRHRRGRRQHQPAGSASCGSAELGRIASESCHQAPCMLPNRSPPLSDRRK